MGEDSIGLRRNNGGLGFRRWEWMDYAHIAKQMWRMLSNPNMLVSKVFEAKYFPGCCVSQFNREVPKQASFAWRSIREVTRVIAEDFEWSEGQRRCVWRKDNSGEYTVKSGYKAIKEASEMRRAEVIGEPTEQKESKFWTRIWHLRIPNKMKIFVWICWHNGLPSRDNLQKRGMGVDNCCFFCRKKSESLVHLLKDCWWDRALVQELALPRILWEVDGDEIKNWLWTAHEVRNEDEFRKLCIFGWLVWKSRNELIFEGRERSILELKVYLEYLVNDGLIGLECVIDWLGEEGVSGRGEPSFAMALGALGVVEEDGDW